MAIGYGDVAVVGELPGMWRRQGLGFSKAKAAPGVFSGFALASELMVVFLERFME